MFQKTSPPGAVGTSLALETIIQHSLIDFKPTRCYVLYCLHLFLFYFFTLLTFFKPLSLGSSSFHLSFSHTRYIYIHRNEASTTILVCSRGGGGLLVERMELVAELWEENIKV